MAPRKRIHQTQTDRARASRAQRTAAGMRQVTIWLSGESIAKLDRLADKRETHRAEIIEGMIRRARE
jgi:hypothetical protein